MLVFKHRGKSWIEEIPITKYAVFYIVPLSANSKYAYWKEKHWEYTCYVRRYVTVSHDNFFVPAVRGYEFFIVWFYP